LAGDGNRVFAVYDACDHTTMAVCWDHENQDVNFALIGCPRESSACHVRRNTLGLHRKGPLGVVLSRGAQGGKEAA
jgi:hypothetical protein